MCMLSIFGMGCWNAVFLVQLQLICLLEVNIVVICAFIFSANHVLGVLPIQAYM